ncbi:DNA polymerase III subunit beta [Bacillus sp. NRRL B-14911]|uniref:DNA polymerase III subunit beta n=1 Tax=Bacillus sp. NRRL B-14911 TaxID=313627 RepID=UPI00006B59CA|nr:DNA polymerase III subunit beta [Bacillus sp. NRRL B-14911]EAR66153.1 DNA polymerase III subunit beta [Bacillus sp. NRRL B-14911]
MKFKMEKDRLQDTVKKIEKVLNIKSSIPILAGVLVQAKADCLLFTASDGTESIIHRVPLDEGAVNIESEGSAVFTKDCFDVTKKLKGSISFELIDQKVIVSQDKTKTRLEFGVMDAEDYPKVAIESTSNPIIFSGKEFFNIVNKTSFAASSSELRPILQGIHMSFSKDGNNFVATDSHRLGKVTTGQSEETMSVTVHAKKLEQVLKSFDFSTEVLVFPTELNIAFANGHTIYYTRLLDGTFPDTSRLIPKEFKQKLVINREEFFDSIDMLSAISREGIVMLSINGLFVELAALGDTAKGSREIAYESFEGESLEVGFSAKYVLDALKSIDSSSISIGFNGGMSPFVIQPLSEEITELQLILPVRLQSN